MAKAMKITVDGDYAEVSMPEGDTLHWFYEQIGCDCVDLVRLDLDLDMWLDDMGSYVNDGENVNLLAAALNLVAGNLQPALWGTAIITRHNGEGDTTGLTDEDIAVLNGALRTLKGRLVETGLIEAKAADRVH